MTRVGFARWRSDLPSGGNRYDEELAAGLRALGVDLREYAVPGAWPFPRPHERRQLVRTLSRERDWLIGNIVGSAAPETLAAATAAGRRITMLIHYFPADEPALSPTERESVAAAEAAAVTAATSVVVTSAWAAAAVAARYGRADVVVAAPGVRPADLAPGGAGRGEPPQLLWLARLTPAKDPLTFVDALIRIADLDWTALLVGPDTVDGDLRQEVATRIARAGLADRIRVPGALEGAALESVWSRTDLLVHTSRAETYGMVVSEALAHGIPSIVAAGTGAVEAQGAGDRFPVGDSGALAARLRAWLTDPGLRDRWRAAALQERTRLPTWAATARSVLEALAVTSASAPVPARAGRGTRRAPRRRTPPERSG